MRGKSTRHAYACNFIISHHQYHVFTIQNSFQVFKLATSHSQSQPGANCLNHCATPPHPTDSQVGIINSALESKQLRIRCLVSCSCVQAVTFTTLSQHTQGCTGHRNLSSLLSSLDSQSSHRFGQPPPPHSTPPPFPSPPCYCLLLALTRLSDIYLLSLCKLPQVCITSPYCCLLAPARLGDFPFLLLAVSLQVPGGLGHLRLLLVSCCMFLEAWVTSACCWCLVASSQ